MEKKTVRLLMVLCAGLTGGFFAIVCALGSLPARVALASLGGACAGMTLYLNGKLARM